MATTTSLQLTSVSFQDGETIPQDHTADGQNVSPQLKWDDPPPGTESFAILLEDPDAPRGTFTHWVMFNLPAESRGLSAGIPPEATLPNGMTHGVNDFGQLAYGGPAPPPGKPHRYYFRLYALDSRLKLKPGVGRSEVLQSMCDHVLAQAELMGTYSR